jgi:ribosome-binding protein aMBF1 (putative translation factor)
MRQIPPPAFGPTLRSARTAARISGRELARRIHVDHSHVARMLRGESCPSQSVAERLIDELKLTREAAAVVRSAAVPGAGQDYPGYDRVRRRGVARRVP